LNTELMKMGWNADLENAMAVLAPENLAHARIAIRHRARYRILDERGEGDAVVAGSFHGAGASEWSTVGDWIAVIPQDNGPSVVHTLLPRPVG
jgi:hypothetical protein